MDTLTGLCPICRAARPDVIGRPCNSCRADMARSATAVASFRASRNRARNTGRRSTRRDAEWIDDGTGRLIGPLVDHPRRGFLLRPDHEQRDVRGHVVIVRPVRTALWSWRADRDADGQIVTDAHGHTVGSVVLHPAFPVFRAGRAVERALSGALEDTVTRIDVERGEVVRDVWADPTFDETLATNPGFPVRAPLATSRGNASGGI